MAIYRPDDRGRHMVGAAQHDRNAALGQPDQQIVRERQTMGIGDEGRHLVERHPADFRLPLRHDQEAAIDREIPAIRRDLDHPSDHRRLPQSGSAAATRQTRPSSSTLTRSAFFFFKVLYEAINHWNGSFGSAWRRSRLPVSL